MYACRSVSWNKIRNLRAVRVRNVFILEAKKMIMVYLKKHPGSHFASEIADELGIDYGLAFKAVNQLLDSGKIKKSRVQ